MKNYIFQQSKWEGETLHWVLAAQGVENHPVCGEVEAATFDSFELGTILTAEFHADVVAKEQDATDN